MTATILLVRHAAHDHLGTVLSGRMPGLALSQEGRAQADTLASLLRGRFDRIESSPVQRAQETAATVGAGTPVEISEGLNEVDFGHWTGQRFDRLDGDPAWVAWNTDRSTASTPGGETMKAAQARVVGHVERSARSGERIAMVSHCDIIRAMVAHVLGLSLNHLLRFAVDAASVTTIEVGAWGSRLVRLNEVPA